MEIKDLHFTPFESKSREELYDFCERYYGYDLIILIRTRFNKTDEWEYSYQVLIYNNNAPTDIKYSWLSDWFEGQTYGEYLAGTVLDYYL